MSGSWGLGWCLNDALVPLVASRGILGKQAPGREFVTPAQPWGQGFPGLEVVLGERFPHLCPLAPTPWSFSPWLSKAAGTLHDEDEFVCCIVGTSAPCIL